MTRAGSEAAERRGHRRRHLAEGLGGGDGLAHPARGLLRDLIGPAEDAGVAAQVGALAGLEARDGRRAHADGLIAPQADGDLARAAARRAALAAGAVARVVEAL